MDRPSNRRDHTEEKVHATGKSDSERWKKSSLYGVPTDKPRPESTSEAARERTSDSRDRPAYRDGRLRLAQQRQQAYQKDCYITPNLSDSSISKSRRPSSGLTSKLHASRSTASELGVPKGWKDPNEDTTQQQAGQQQQIGQQRRTLSLSDAMQQLQGYRQLGDQIQQQQQQPQDQQQQPQQPQQ